MVKTYGLNLSTATTSGPFACTLVSANDYSNVNFNINWDTIFKGKTGEAQLKFKLCGKSSTTYTFNSDMGYIVLNGIAAPYSNNCNLGLVQPTNDSTSLYSQQQYVVFGTASHTGNTLTVTAIDAASYGFLVVGSQINLGGTTLYIKTVGTGGVGTYTTTYNGAIASTSFYSVTHPVSVYNPQSNYLYGTNLDTNGVTVKIPQGYSSLNIQILDLTNNIIVTSEQYFIWLYFEVEE